jgi:hypothetical protein
VPRLFVHEGIAGMVAIGCIGALLATAGQHFWTAGAAGGGAEAPAYETTGGVDAGSAGGRSLSLSDEGRELVYRYVQAFPDVGPGSARPLGVSERVSDRQELQDLPTILTETIPLLRGYKVVKLDDRILLIDPASREVVVMLPRYRLLP